MNILVFKTAMSKFSQGGSWECYCKYIEQNYFVHFLSMQFTDRGHLAVVALIECQKVITAR